MAHLVKGSPDAQLVSGASADPTLLRADMWAKMRSRMEYPCLWW